MQLIQLPPREKPKFERIVIAMNDDPPPTAPPVSEPPVSIPTVAVECETESSTVSEIEFVAVHETFEAESEVSEEFDSSPDGAATPIPSAVESVDVAQSAEEFPDAERKRRSKRSRRRERKPKHHAPGDASANSPQAPSPEPTRTTETPPAPEASAPPSDGFGEGIDP